MSYPGHMAFGRVVRPFAGQEGEVPDPERGDRVEGEALLQVVGLVEAAVLDARADLERMEEALDPPAQLVPAQNRAGGVEAGLALAGQQHPVQRLAKRTHLTRG